MKRRRKTTRGKQARRVFAGHWARGQLSPSPEDSHRGWDPRPDCISTPLGDFFFEINTEKRVFPTPQHETQLSAAAQLTEAELGTQGCEVLGSGGLPQTP